MLDTTTFRSVALAALMCIAPALAVPASAGEKAGADWPRWRGPFGNGHTPEVPGAMPELKPLWTRPMAGKCDAGVSAGEGCVVVADNDKKNDYYRCFDAATGKPVWTATVPNGQKLDFGPGPRATPAIDAGKVFCIGAFGDLHAYDLKTGKELWAKDYRKDFGVKDVPVWGFCVAPLVADGKLLVMPGNLLALDPNTGKTLWTGPAAGANYATPIVATLGGVRQVIGYDSKTVGGWALATGKRLWSFEVDNSSGYIVPGPVQVGEKLLLTSENEDTRLLAFAEGGKAVEKPAAESEELCPEMATPTVVGKLLVGITQGLVALDPAAKLKTAWILEDVDAFYGLGHIVAHDGRAMLFGEDGTMLLLRPTATKCEVLGKAKISEETWCHPALARGRLFARDARKLYAYELKAK